MAKSNIGSVVLSSYPIVENPYNSTQLYPEVAFRGYWQFKLNDITYGFLEYLDKIYVKFYFSNDSSWQLTGINGISLSGNSSYTFSVYVGFTGSGYQGESIKKIEILAYRKNDDKPFGNGTYEVTIQSGTAVNPYKFPSAPYLSNIAIKNEYLCEKNFSQFDTILLNKDTKKFEIFMNYFVPEGLTFSTFSNPQCTISNSSASYTLNSSILKQEEGYISLEIDASNVPSEYKDFTITLTLKLCDDIGTIVSSTRVYKRNCIIPNYDKLNIEFFKCGPGLIEYFKITFEDIAYSHLYPELNLNTKETLLFENYCLLHDNTWINDKIYEKKDGEYKKVTQKPEDWNNTWYNYYIKGDVYALSSDYYRLYIDYEQQLILEIYFTGNIVNFINNNLKMNPNIRISFKKYMNENDVKEIALGYQYKKFDDDMFMGELFKTKLKDFQYLNRGKEITDEIGGYFLFDESQEGSIEKDLYWFFANGILGSSVKICYNIYYEGAENPIEIIEELNRSYIDDEKILYTKPMNFLYENREKSNYKKIWNDSNNDTQILKIEAYPIYEWEDKDKYDNPEQIKDIGSKIVRYLRLNRLVSPKLNSLKCDKNQNLNLNFEDSGLDKSESLNLSYFEILTDSTMKKYGNTEETLSIYNIDKIILKLIKNSTEKKVEYTDKTDTTAKEFITNIIKGDSNINIKTIFETDIGEGDICSLKITYVYNKNNELNSNEVIIQYIDSSSIQTISLRKNQVGINGEPKYGASIYTEKFELDDIVSDIAILGDLVIQLSTGKIYRKDSNGDKYVYDGKINDAPPTTEKEYLKVKNQACINGEPKYGASIYTETSNLSDITILGKMVIQLSTGEIYREDKNGDKYVYNGKINDDAPGTGIEYLKVLKII